MVSVKTILAPQVSPFTPPVLFPRKIGTRHEKNKPESNNKIFFIRFKYDSFTIKEVEINKSKKINDILPSFLKPLQYFW